MKKLLILLTVVCVFTAAIVGFTLVAGADDSETVEYTGDIETLKGYAETVLAKYATAVEADVTDPVIASAKTLDNYLFFYTFDPAAEGYAETMALVEKAMAVGIVSVLDSYDESAEYMYVARSTAQWAERFIDNTPEIGNYYVESARTRNIADLAKVGEERDEAKKTVAEYCADVLAHMNDRLEKTREALYNSTPLEELGWKIYVENDFDKDAQGLHVAAKVIPVTNKAATSYIVYPGDGMDGYYMFDDSKPLSPDQTSSVPHTGAYWKIPDVAADSVFQFDFSHFTEYSGVSLGSSNSSKDYSQAYLSISNGTITPSGSDLETGKKVTVTDAIVPGKWTNIALAFNNSTGECRLYIDYELITTFILGDDKAKVPGNYGVTSTDIRMTITAAGASFAVGHGKSFALDNAATYNGTAPRDCTMLLKMDELTQFEYFVNYLSMAGVSPKSCFYAHQSAFKLLPDLFKESENGPDSVTDFSGKTIRGTFLGAAAEDEEGYEKYRELIETLYLFDNTSAKEQVSTDNSQYYIDTVKELQAIERSYETLINRNTVITALDDFVLKNEGYFDEEYSTSDMSYKEAVALYAVLKTKAKNDEHSLSFVETMEAFKKAYDGGRYKKMTVAYEEATEILKSAALDEDLKDDRLTSAYSIYVNANNYLLETQRIDNTESFIKYMEYSKQFPSKEYWEAEYETLSPVVKRARDIINSGLYNSDYEGFDEMLKWYETINAYFLECLQADHVVYLTELHDKYRSTDSYIERISICRNFKNYVDSNDIDYSNSQIKALIAEHESYVEDLGGLTIDVESAAGQQFIETLNTNTANFISLTKKLSVSTNYVDIAALLSEAEQCYYRMIVGTPEVDAAIAIYEKYVNYKKLVDDSSLQFTVVVFTLSGAKSAAEKYNVLAEAYSLLGYVENSIDGVSEAKAVFDAAYAEYYGVIAPITTDVSAVISTICSLRYSCGGTVIAEFANISK